MFKTIPGEWRRVPLSALGQRVRRRNTIGNTNVLTISAVHGLVNQREFFNKIVASENLSNYFLLKRGEFAYNKSYSNGYPVGVVRRLKRYQSGILSPLYICFDMSSSDVDERYAEHFFDSQWFIDEINQIAKEGARNHGLLNVGVGDFFDLEFVLPPLPEQRKIAAILSSVDDVIEKTRAQIDKLKDLKTGMMQELLTKGIGHVEFKDSPVGRIPACWEVRKADDISGSIMVGVVIKPTQYYVDQGVPALRSANVRENGLTMDNLKYFSPESNDQLHKSKLRKGDLLTVRTGYPGTTAVVTDEFEGCNCIDVVITRPSAEMDSHFFSLWVNSDQGKGQVLKAQGGLAQQHFNVGDMKNLLVPVPPLEEQRDIFRAVDSVIKKLSTSEKRLAGLNNLKKALMQDLLTGKVRVNVSEKETAVA
ncbi:restriction endonuclease subunit S [Marinobacter qingdaonensis]|uniref:Restriction endonuclease subunit S n=1 Tax=Marinobacter qingdaonensis TaxID=3108486 RepID=A0ABU5NYJ7_9GAMM|nr:restriction endonuclease subunit S [Marinobacter sp. ASW11-75]MEA1080864.1 restriction endonuclease subunit S [Marinobacter sp. ASW11-75]